MRHANADLLDNTWEKPSYTLVLIALVLGPDVDGRNLVVKIRLRSATGKIYPRKVIRQPRIPDM
jgi:hypothetical protein